MTPAEAAALMRLPISALWSGKAPNLTPSTQAGPLPTRARAITAGGQRLPGELVADTLEQLRPMLPAALTRRDRSPFDFAETVETWD